MRSGALPADAAPVSPTASATEDIIITTAANSPKIFIFIRSNPSNVVALSPPRCTRRPASIIDDARKKRRWSQKPGQPSLGLSSPAIRRDGNGGQKIMARVVALAKESQRYAC